MDVNGLSACTFIPQVLLVPSMDPEDSSVIAVEGQSLMEVPCPVDQTPQNCNFDTDDCWRLRLTGVCVCGEGPFLWEQMAPRLGLKRSISGPFTGPCWNGNKNTYANAIVATGCQYCRAFRQLWPRDAGTAGSVPFVRSMVSRQCMTWASWQSGKATVLNVCFESHLGKL